MTTRQRALLIGLGVVLAVLVGVLLAVLASDDGEQIDTSAGTTTSSSSTTSTVTSTTVALVPVRPSTTASRPSDTAPATTATTLPPAIEASSPVLRPPSATERRTRTGGCESLGDGPAWEIECGVVDSAGVRLVWLTERRSVDGALRAYVFRRLSGDSYAVALSMRDEGPAGPETYQGVKVRVADVSGRGNPEIVFGFRLQGSGSFLAVELVEAPGRVAFDLEVEKGSARVSGGQLDVWGAQFAPSDPNCCPSSYRHRVVGFRSGAWRAVIDEVVDPESVPTSQL